MTQAPRIAIDFGTTRTKVAYYNAARQQAQWSVRNTAADPSSDAVLEAFKERIEHYQILARRNPKTFRGILDHAQSVLQGLAEAIESQLSATQIS